MDRDRMIPVYPTPNFVKGGIKINIVGFDFSSRTPLVSLQTKFQTNGNKQ